MSFFLSRGKHAVLRSVLADSDLRGILSNQRHIMPSISIDSHFFLP